MAMCYDTGLLRNSFYLINKKLGIKFTDILQEWDGWMRKEHNGVMRILKGNSNENGKISRIMKWMAVRKIANLAIDFIEFLYKKYNGPPVDKELLKSVQNETKIFLEKQGIREENV